MTVKIPVRTSRSSVIALAGAIAMVVALLFSVSSAQAIGEPKPLHITSFALLPTEAVKTPLSRESWGFEYRPVPFVQAGGHPDALTTKFEFETEEVYNGFVGEYFSSATRDVKDVDVDPPPGLLGNPTAVPRCPLKVALGRVKACPADTQVGTEVITYGGVGYMGPLVNVTPEAGQSAEFAFENTANFTNLLTGHVVRTAGGYGLSVTSNGIPSIGITSVEVTFWGVPSAASHDPQRGLFCSRIARKIAEWACGGINTNPSGGLGGESSGTSETPFLTWPTNCAAGPLPALISADSWEEPGVYTSVESTMPGVTGCNLLQFDPGIGVEPDTLLADAPVGLGVNLTVPQSEEPQRLGTPELRSAVVTLPEGMSISPGIVDGIKACNESGPEGINFTGPESEEVGLNGELQLAAGHCPNASTVGTAEAITPLLSKPLKGHIYLARPGCGGRGQAGCTKQDAVDGNLYKLYLELGGTGPLANTGVHLKIPGEVQANPATGQLTTRFEGFPVGDPPRFDGNPQLPFSELKVSLNGGPRAPIDNPAACGAARTSADLAPWSAPGITPQGLSMAGLPDATPSSFFEVEPQNCPNHPGLSPGFVAGTVTPNAGKFSAFTMNLARQDREQYVKGIQLHTPPGLLAMLSSVQLCGETEADTGHCPESSKIGTTRVASGAGSHPFEIEGTVYLTGPYGGAPFGLSIVTPAIAGPFNLGLVVVRARINIDPVDSTATITLDETGPYAIPQIVDGVPLRLKRVTANIDRAGFMFNPTNCDPEQVTAVISGSEEAKANVSSPLAVGGCQSLAFKPSFTVSTSGKTSKANGASLDAKLSYPAGSVGSEANIASVKVELPKQLPSRLTTLQKACTAATFEANPADCPSASVIGIVRASTPLLPVGLTGPVYFVSHGGEAFPSLVIVLQGDGVRVDLTAATFISKAGITSSTFKTIPDVPVNTFEIYLPEGRYSALTANSNLCDQTTTVTTRHKVTRKAHGHLVRRTVTTRKTKPASLVMPSEFVAQNGAVLKQNTIVQATGCASSKPKNKPKPKPKRRAKAKKSSATRRARS
jgi:hypothetical protein